MWPSQNYGFNRPVLLITTPLIQTTSPLPRFQNVSNFSQNMKPVCQSVQHHHSSSKSPHRKSTLSNVVDETTINPTLSVKNLIDAFKKFEDCVTEKVTNLVDRNRVIERRMFTTLGLNIEAANNRFLANKQMFEDFKIELKEDFAKFHTEQDKLMRILKCGMDEIKLALSGMESCDDNYKIDPTILQLAPKFDESYKNYPTGFLKHFETFVKTTRSTPALQRLLFIYAVQLDNPIWREHVANIETFEGLKKPFLDLTWSKKQQMRVYMEFEKASFKHLSPEEINAEVKKWCDIVRDMQNVNFRHFRISLTEKLPRHWQTTLSIFAINDCETLIKHIDMCLDNESVIHTNDCIKFRSDSGQNLSEAEK
ncbi:uncharacterized protein LOC135832533 [Planococcus citri]|uniref:uncharacterized protein LOC135832533 n=1 Tax=Planococcus citri TaxID=170843 RepID=UPI0031F829AD